MIGIIMTWFGDMYRFRYRGLAGEREIGTCPRLNTQWI
jgi:hypothetical protein